MVVFCTQLVFAVNIIGSDITNSSVSDDSLIIDSIVNNSIINSSNIYNSTILLSGIHIATINLSNITNCTIEVLEYNGITSGLDLLSANLMGDSNQENCRLLSGSAVVDQDGIDFVYSVETYLAQPLVSDIWNITPSVSIIGLSNNTEIYTSNLSLFVSIGDDGLGNSIMDHVDVGWTVFLNSSNTTSFTLNNLRDSNISLNLVHYDIVDLLD